MASSKASSAWDLLLEWLRHRGQRRKDLYEEMEDLIEAGTAEGVLNEEEEEMLLSVLSFRKTLVREVMVPRTEMVCVEVLQPLEALVRVMVEEGHSRIPIFEEDIDHVVGFVTARDVLRFWQAPPPHPSLREILRPAYLVPETMNLEALLAEMKRRRLHLAMAVDEYGGVSGLVTLEDLLEEIVGDIQDEYDEEDVAIRETGDGYRAAGRTEIEKIEQVLDIDLGDWGDFETVGGLAFHVLGHIPKPGEMFLFHGLEITVVDADKRRVKEVRIRKRPPPEPLGEDGDQTAKP